MEKELQEFQKWFNMTEEENLSHSFLNYLQKLNQSDQLKEIALNINWKSILDLFDIEFNKLEKSFIIPDNIPEIKEIKNSFRNSLLGHLNASIFYLMILELNGIIENKINGSLEINKKILKGFNIYLNHLFSIFDFQNSLVMLNERNDKNIIILKIEELKNKAKFGEKFSGKNFRPYEKPSFEKIIEIYNQKLNDGEKQTYKYISNKIAKNDLGLIHEKERNDFYKRFTEYKRKIKSVIRKTDK